MQIQHNPEGVSFQDNGNRIPDIDIFRGLSRPEEIWFIGWRHGWLYYSVLDEALMLHVCQHFLTLGLEVLLPVKVFSRDI